MEGYQSYGGAAEMLRMWRRREGYRMDGRYLVVSSGDMWTGPAVSSSLLGESMVDVMNAMGYRAAALGNHDFDFGQDVVRQRRQQAAFPFLGANIVLRGSQRQPDYVQPYALIDVNGVRVGVLGLATTETPVDTRPTYVADLEFRSYRETLERYLPEMWAAGADAIVVLGHLCESEMAALAGPAADLGVSLIAGGHCHVQYNEVASGVRLIESAYFLIGYTRVDLLVDTAQNRVVSLAVEYVPNRGRADRELAARIEGWTARLPQALLEPLGFARQGISRDSPEMARLILGAWLEAYPQAQVALISTRYISQDLPAGVVSEATIVGLLPAENELVCVELTGEQLLSILEERRPLVAGLVEGAGGYMLSDGSPLTPEALVSVLLPDALYLGENYYSVAQFDPTPTHTGIGWREPTLSLLRRLATGSAHPLEEALASLP